MMDVSRESSHTVHKFDHTLPEGEVLLVGMVDRKCRRRDSAERPRMRSIHRLLTTAAALTAAVTLAPCSGTTRSLGSGGSGQPRGAKEHGGTVTVAWVAATPNLIFPLSPATNTDGYNV